MTENGSRDDLLQRLEREIRKVSAQSALFIQGVAERVGINSSDLECLEIVVMRRPVTAGQLAEATGLTTGAITGVIDRLEGAGYVRRTRDARDRRRVLIEPTAKVDADIAPLFRSCQSLLDTLWSAYGEDQLAVILDFLTRSSATMDAEIGRLRAPPPAPPGPG